MPHLLSPTLETHGSRHQILPPCVTMSHKSVPKVQWSRLPARQCRLEPVPASNGDMIHKAGLPIPHRALSSPNGDTQVPLEQAISLAVSQMAYKRAWPCYPCHCVVRVAERQGSRQHGEAQRTGAEGCGFKLQCSSTLLRIKKEGSKQRAVYVILRPFYIWFHSISTPSVEQAIQYHSNE